MVCQQRREHTSRIHPTYCRDSTETNPNPKGSQMCEELVLGTGTGTANGDSVAKGLKMDLPKSIFLLPQLICGWRSIGGKGRRGHRGLGANPYPPTTIVKPPNYYSIAMSLCRCPLQ